MFTPEEILKARAARSESRLDSLETQTESLRKKIRWSALVNLVLLLMLLTGFFY